VGGAVAGAAAGSSGATGSSSRTPPSTALTLPDGSHYTVEVMLGRAVATRAGSPCAQVPVSGRYDVPVTLVVRNTGTSAAPQPPLGLLLEDDPKLPLEVAAIAIQGGACEDFLLTAYTIAPGGELTYVGTVSSASRTSRLVVNLKGQPLAHTSDTRALVVPLI